MENAGRGVAEQLLQRDATSPVAICCGKGNNAGDGFVIARHLDRCGIDVQVLLLFPADELHGDALVNFEIVRRSGIPWEQIAPVDGDKTSADQLAERLSAASWVVDALLGTGVTGDPRPPLDMAIKAINVSGRRVLAVDVPSGLDADTGQPGSPTVEADVTCTFVAPKPGFFVARAEPFIGDLEVLSIGAPRCLVEEMLGG